jgi:hypothetical protein
VDDERTGRSRWDSDDALLAHLGELLRERDAPPADAVDLARQSFGLRTIDAELAALTADSGVEELVGVRSAGTATGPRLLTFEAADLAVEVEIDGSGRTRRLLGQLVPGGPAAIDVRGRSGRVVRVAADERGRFTIDDLAPGPVSLVCRRGGRRPVATAWMSLD